MSLIDEIRKKMKKEDDATLADASEQPETAEETTPLTDVSLEDLPALIKPAPARGKGGRKLPMSMDREYRGKKTISASIPASVKAAVDYITLHADEFGKGKYLGFGGKSRFIAEALVEKLERDFPEVWDKLQRS